MLNLYYHNVPSQEARKQNSGFQLVRRPGNKLIKLKTPEGAIGSRSPENICGTGAMLDEYIV
ncbi:hypothetical protein CASFOL_028272 [Castilleja foliolosa]|uniref:Uncharacterized protein n=1 Tax=Castilleja foliolosa TaxID=1961234 RepID=A0ABD3CGP5_9LAMI